MSTFPSILTSYTNPQPTDKLNAPSHSGIETNQNSGLMQVEAVIGVEGSASVVGSLQYLIKSPASDGGGHVQTAVLGGTGQTTYTKGDILVSSSPSVLTKLSIGSDNTVLIADSTQATGIKWGSPTLAPTVRTYTNPSILTWNKPSILSYIVVEVQGAGGGGGGVNAPGSPGNAAGGGAGGGYSRKVYTSSMLTLTATVTVGALGTGGSAGDNDGVIGGDSSFLVNAITSIIGKGGGFGQKGTVSSGGGTGIASGGDININGSGGGSGSAGTTNGTLGGTGGDSFMGFGGYGRTPQTTGNAAGGFGGGGGGGAAISTTAGGGNGSNGIVIVYEY